MKTTPGAILFLATATASAWAASEIVPTADQGSDCVAAIIVVQRKQELVPSFTDRCNAPHEVAYVSFNGETHPVWRQAQEPHPDVTYAGTWQGDDVVVRVLPRKLVERFEENRVMYAVDVPITSGNTTVSVPATYDNRM